MATGRTSRRTGRRAQSAEAAARWNEILNAAAQSFYEKGYEGTSLQEIAEAAGLLKASIFYYIKSKEDLLLALVTRAQEQFASMLVEDEELAAAPIPDRLRAFVDRWMALSETDREWNVVAEREFTRLSPANLELVIANRDKASAFVKGLLSDGIQDGYFDPNVDLSLATTVIFELMLTTHLWHRPDARLTIAEVGHWYGDFIIRGLAPAAGAAAPTPAKPAKRTVASKRMLTSRA